MKKKSYEHLKKNLLLTLKHISGTENVIGFIEKDEIKKALEVWDKTHHSMNFSLSNKLARQQIEWTRNNLIALLNATER